MRISTVQMQNQALNIMQERSSELARTQLELATGLRIELPLLDTCILYLVTLALRI